MTLREDKWTADKASGLKCGKIPLPKSPGDGENTSITGPQDHQQESALEKEKEREREKKR